MTTNIKNYAVGVTEDVRYARRSTSGIPEGTTGALAQGADQGMLRHKGFASLTDTPATAESVPITGDGGNLGTMFSRSIDNSTGTITFNAIDQTFQGVAEDLSVYSDGDHEKIGIDDSSCAELNDLSMIINSRATSLETASLDEKGWEVIEYFNLTAEKTDHSTSGTEFTAQPQGYNLTFTHASLDMDGVTISNTNYNRTKLRGVRYWSENPVNRHTLIGDGVATTVTLDETPAAENGDKVKVYIDGTAKAYTTDYTVNATTKVVTFVAAPGADEEVVIAYEFIKSC
jgi:azurin